MHRPPTLCVGHNTLATLCRFTLTPLTTACKLYSVLTIDAVESPTHGSYINPPSSLLHIIPLHILFVNVF